MAAAFLGVLDIPLRTFTNSYVAWSGGAWTWQSNSLQPMEFAGRLDIANNALVAFGCTVFDYATGATKYGYGNNAAGAVNNNAGAVLFKRSAGNVGNIAGWLFSQALSKFPYNFSDNVTLGVAKTVPVLQATAPFAPLPNVANTAIPSPVAGGNWYDQLNLIQCSYRVNLVERYVAYNPLSGAATDEGASLLGFTSALTPSSSIPYAGTNWLWITDTTGGTPNKHVMSTPNFIASTSLFVPHLTNPPGSSIDLDVYINAIVTNPPTSTYKGFLWINRNALTITGRALNGFGILVMPDFSGYYLINFVPVDASAANWQAGVSDIQAKIDDTGVFWMKLTSTQALIFSSQPLQNNVLQTYPPIGIPTPPNDSQLTVRALRGYAL